MLLKSNIINGGGNVFGMTIRLVCFGDLRTRLFPSGGHLQYLCSESLRKLKHAPHAPPHEDSKQPARCSANCRGRLRGRLLRRRLPQTDQVRQELVCAVGAGGQLTPQAKAQVDPPALAKPSFDERT